MDLEKIKGQTWLAWSGVTLLVILCAVLAGLQFRWIGEVAAAERQRLRDDLQSRMDLLRRNLNEQISARCYAYIPTASQIERLGREEAYLGQYRRRKDSGDEIVQRAALAVPASGTLVLLFPDASGNHFAPANWPPEWSGMRDRLLARLQGGPMIPYRSQVSTLVEFPRFSSPEDSLDKRGGGREQEWLVLQLNQDFIGSTLIPGILNRYLGEMGKLDYDADVVLNGNPSVSIYRSPSTRGDGATWKPDASVTLLEIAPTRRFGTGPSVRPGPPFFGDRPSEGANPPPPDSARGLWLLRVHHRAGSLETIVAQARRRNIVLSLGILLLLLATVASLVRFSGRVQRTADLQMNFVAGVSHELRTPLTVIRTAAYNLRGFASEPEQVMRYGALIQKESEKLSSLVEQVLRYGNARAGRAVQKRALVSIESLIESSLQATHTALDAEEFIVERRIEPGLPPVLADEEAMKHALQNLLDNALKYGTQGSKWIGINAAMSTNGTPPMVEIRVADRGPGIPPKELEHIFDSFFRGQRALQNQIHGTGLGLSLVKKTVEAHGGSVDVKSEPGEGVEFIVRIPVAPPELQNDLAHSSR